MLQKRDWMSWVWNHKCVILLAVFLGFSSCSDTYPVPAEVVSVELEDNHSQKVEIFQKLAASDEEFKSAWGCIGLSKHFTKESQFVEALFYLRQAEVVIDKLNIQQLQPVALYLKAHIYWNLGFDIDIILEFSKQAVSLADKDLRNSAEGNYATYLLDARQYEKVIEIEEPLIRKFKSNYQNLSEAQAVLGSAYYEIGTRMSKISKRSVESVPMEGLEDYETQDQGSQGYIDMGRDLMNQSLETVNEIDNIVDKNHVYRRALNMGALNAQQLRECVQFAESNGLYRLAYAARKSIKNFLILNETQEEGLARMVDALEKSIHEEESLRKRLLKYQFNRLSEERLTFEKQAVFRQFTYVVALFTVLLIVLILVLTFRAQDSANQATIEKQNSNILLANYKNRIRPHFLFNQLNNVNGFISQEKWNEAQEYLGLLSVHLRSILDSSDEEKTTVWAEFDRIENYVALQQKSSYGHVVFHKSIGKKSEGVKIPTGLLQPLVENSYKYSGNASEKNSWIKLSSEVMGDAVVITVEDSGYGFLERIPGTGIGLALVRERINFNRSASRRPNLWKISTDYGKRKSIVKLTMPLH
ncbi:MAG: hypothetical protein CMP53_06865 [Flavobacteriales bacterium]|nr:hypothetical protein [Flavobacteriales bacterium]